MTREDRLEILRQDWQRSHDRVHSLSHLAGRDHVQITIMIVNELKYREALKEQILALTPKETADENLLRQG